MLKKAGLGDGMGAAPAKPAATRIVVNCSNESGGLASSPPDFSFRRFPERLGCGVSCA